ncbi:hypothetical protein V6N13_067727 [Hibiscus sabdariffa]|uniref:CRIB domain-containing protein n=1 Tax=Hibiscus sabdariffa TaxID=183260 RepID=A0ABR2DVE1_9ROSI
MERFVILPFGCVSESSVAVAVQQQQPRRSNSKPAYASSSSATRTRHEEEDEDEECLSMKSDVSPGFHKLLKGFKTFSQLFGKSIYIAFVRFVMAMLTYDTRGVLVYKEEMEEEEDMEIGLPTDVKHVAHVGLDETESSRPSMGRWDNLLSTRHLFTFPSPQCEPTKTQAAFQAST